VTAADTVPDEFDPTVPVGPGVTVLEASAGTGKTHAVASLVVAEVAAGRRIDELLVVTFTRKATGTLRERVWQRLSAAAEALAPDAAEPADPLLAHLRTGASAEVAARRARLRRAVAGFDAATIATTHGFCQQVLAGLGVAGDAERTLELTEHVGDLVADAVDDLFVRRFHDRDDVPLERKEAQRIADAVVNRPDCEIGPVDDNETDRLRRRFAKTLRDRIDEQKRRRRLITYDDLLSRLDESLADDERGAIVAERLRRRFSMAVVDEFQDTDRVQWRILHRAFGAEPSRLVLVGDPKQAIYAFRGGDVVAYLNATANARHRRTLPVSWRADRSLLAAQDALLGGAQLGHADIRHRRLRPRPDAPDLALTGPAAGPAMTVRIAHRDGGGFELGKQGWAAKASVRRFIADDLAAHAVRLLDAGTTIDGRPLDPADLAVLTRTHQDADRARTALQAAGVPAVVHGVANVFASAAAGHWLELLHALEAPSSVTRVHAVALGPFFGWPADRLASRSDADWDTVNGTLHDWAAALRARGVAGLLRSIEVSTGPTERLLAGEDGARTVSDLRHLGELLHDWQAAHPGSIAALAAWLGTQMAQSDRAGAGDTRRRLDTDAGAVTIQTIHGAKGLEFPVVLLPSLWDAPWEDDKELPVFHNGDDERLLGVGSAGPVRRWQCDRAAAERDGEELRLLYVALTRARHQVVVWWAAAYDGDRSALARILCGVDADTGAVPARLKRTPDEDTITAELDRRGIPHARATGPAAPRPRPGASRGPALAVAPFARRFDEHWTRTSYSGLTAAAHDLALATGAMDAPGTTAPTAEVDLDGTGTADEPAGAVPAGAAAAADPALGAVVPLGDLPGGARIGTLIHEVLERVDFTAADLSGELRGQVADAGVELIAPGHGDTLVAGLVQFIETPLGPTWDDLRLRDLGPGDRLDELSFELPLAGGDDPTAALVTMDAVADVFATLPAGDPVAGYHERLREPALAAAVRGFLTGSIDLVARTGGRHIVIDYKSNRLAPAGEPLVAAHYRPAALTDAMADAHYPLQAALYLVALHRFLRWRQAGYDADRHLGGVAYLFLRGMVGAGTPTVDGHPCGVFTWQPPASFVTGLSDLLDRGAP
jgi:exodeoxyribonuclease V beta subunit